MTDPIAGHPLTACPYQPLGLGEACGATPTHHVAWRRDPEAAAFGACADHAWRYANNRSFTVTPLAAAPSSTR